MVVNGLCSFSAGGRESSRGLRHKMIVTDGVFSMDGDIAPLKDICTLAERCAAP